MRIFRVNFRRIFITGVLIVLPALITFFLLHFLFGKVNRHITPHLRRGLSLLPGWEGFAHWIDPVLPILALALTLVLIFAVGLLGTNYLGKRLIDAFHNVMLRIPMVKGVYGSAKQLFDAFRLPGVRAFEKVCMLEYPRRGLYCLGFLTRETDGELREALGQDSVYVFLPTTPNPTSGYLILVPRNDIRVLEMSIEEGIKLIVSGGMVPPANGVENSPGIPPAEEEPKEAESD